MLLGHLTVCCLDCACWSCLASSILRTLRRAAPSQHPCRRNFLIALVLSHSRVSAYDVDRVCARRSCTLCSCPSLPPERCIAWCAPCLTPRHLLHELGYTLQLRKLPWQKHRTHAQCRLGACSVTLPALVCCTSFCSQRHAPACTSWPDRHCLIALGGTCRTPYGGCSQIHTCASQTDSCAGRQGQRAAG
jgi:hypothetical protein